MALNDEGSGGNMVMPVSPMGGYGGGGGFFGGDYGAWIILFLICMMWGGFGGGWGMNGMNGGLGIDFPWLMNANSNTDALVTAGFANQATQTALNGIQNGVTGGFGDVQLGIAGVNQGVCQAANAITGAVTGAQNAITQQMYSGQIADLERSFAAQTAAMQGMNALQAQAAQNASGLQAQMAQGSNDLQAQLAQCCCDNRLATAQTQALVQAESGNTRVAMSDGVRDIIASQTAGTQRVLDMMCQDKIDVKNEKIAELQNQLSMAQLAATQNAQTAAIIANNQAQTSTLEQYLAPVPRPAYLVQNPNGCGSTYACGMA